MGVSFLAFEFTFCGDSQQKIFSCENACVHNEDGTAMLSPGSAIDPIQTNRESEKEGCPFFFFFLSLFFLVRVDLRFRSMLIP